MTQNPTHTQESEVALTISSDHPQRIVDRIADLTSIADYQLVPGDVLEMRDLYFDTQERAFDPQKLALRVREFGGTQLVALKGPPRPADWGGLERLEIEEPWSHAFLKRIVYELAQRGIELRQSQSTSDSAHPREVLRSLGLQIIQDRETRRRESSVLLRGDKSGPVLAEMAVDSVVYRLGEEEIRHYEVEIESKSEAGKRVITPVCNALKASFDEALKETKHSKLAIGFALEELRSEGGLEGDVDANGNLKPSAYDKIDRYLRSKAD